MSRRLLGATVLAVLGVMTTPAAAQVEVRTVTLQTLATVLSRKDPVIIVQLSGEVVRGRFVAFGDDSVKVEIDVPRLGGQASKTRTIGIPLGTIRSVERLPDSPGEGAVIGLAVGAIIGAANFIGGMAVDQNEMDEWAGGALLGGVMTAGLGAVLGWMGDAAHSKPHIRFDIVPADVAAAPPGEGLLLPPLPVEPVAPESPPPDASRVGATPRTRAIPGADTHVAVRAGFGWGSGLESNSPTSAYPDGIPGHVAPRTTANHVAVGYGADLFTVWGEFTQHVPPTVTDEWMELETGNGTFLPLDDWPSQTSGRQRVRAMSSNTGYPYSGSILVGYHPAPSRQEAFRDRIEWTVLIGLTLILREEHYVQQDYIVVGGARVPQPTFDVVGAPFTKRHRNVYAALALGLDAKVPLTRHLSVVPNVRADLLSGLSRARAGAGLQWTF